MKGRKGAKKMKKNLLFNNTYDEGKVTLFVYEEKKKFVGVCLEFDLVVEADTLSEAKEQIVDYVQAWHKNAVEYKLPEEVLNRPADKKYWKIYSDILKREQERAELEEKSPSQSKFNKSFVASFIDYRDHLRPMAFC